MKKMVWFPAALTALTAAVFNAQAFMLDESLMNKQAQSRSTSGSGNTTLFRAIPAGDGVIPVVDLPEVTVSSDNPVSGRFATVIINGKAIPVVELPVVTITAPYHEATMVKASWQSGRYIASVDLPAVEVLDRHHPARAEALAGDDLKPQRWFSVTGHWPVMGACLLIVFMLTS